MSLSAGRAAAGCVSELHDDASTSLISRPNVHPRPYPRHWAARPEEVRP